MIFYNVWIASNRRLNIIDIALVHSALHNCYENENKISYINALNIRLNMRLTYINYNII